MIRYLSSNPNGWLFAGDTAQTIASGSSFRFNDLKAAVYRQEERQAQLADRKPVESKLFSLSLNYRSHAGITRVGSSLVDALLRLFPESIDRLPAERGLVEGPKPIWLLSSEDPDAGDDLTSNFLFGEAGSAVEFGAEQVILVRNEAARESLRKKTGDVGLIMTIAESKGLEFSEILLWDYFADSTSSAADWRVVLNLWKSGKGVPTFDAVRHASIGQELRCLYVAVTRARNVLCIVDRDRTGDAMRSYFEHLQLIRTIRSGDPLPNLAAASSSALWLKQGRAMYGRRLYRQAAQCFRKAGAKLEEAIPNAYEERRKAKAAFRLAGRSTTAVVASFARVATLFRDCAQLAGKSSSQRAKLYVVSAELFLSADRLADAASDYEQAGEFDRSALLFLRARKIEEAVRVVKAHVNMVEDSTRAKVFYPARLSYLKRGKIESAKSLFTTDEELLAFAEDYGFDDVQRELLVTLGRFEQAARLGMDDGQLRIAATLYSKVGNHDSSVMAARCLSELLSQQLPFGASDDWPDEKRFTQASEMLKETSSVLEAIKEPFDSEQELRKEISMYQLVTSKDLIALRTLGFEWKEEDNLAHALNSLDAALSEIPDFSFTSLNTINAYIGDVEAYSSLVRRLLKQGGKLDISDPPTQRLLGLRRAEGGENLELSDIKVLPTSPLFFLLPKPGQGEEKDAARLVPVAVLRPLASRFLAKRLDDFLFLTSDSLSKARDLRPPCFAFAMASCTHPQCDRLHVSPGNLTEARFQSRLDVLSAVLRMTAAFDFVTSILGEGADGAARRAEQNKWLDILSLSLHPPHAFSGASGEALDRKREGDWLLTTARIARRAEDALLRIPSTIGSAILPKWTRLAMLASDISPASFSALGSRIPLVTSKNRDLQYHHGRSQRPVTQGLVLWLQLKADAPIVWQPLQGILNVVEHISNYHLPFDATALVELLEDLGALAILSAATKSGSLDDPWCWNELLLPRSVMHRLIRFVSSRDVVDFPQRLVNDLVKVIIRVLRSLLEDSSCLQVGGPVSASSSEASNVALASRLLRLLGLLGQRDHGGKLKRNILSRLREVSGLAARASPILAEFAEAITYSELETAALNFGSAFVLDGMVQLDLAPAADLSGVVGVRVVRATSLTGIQSQLFPTARSAKAKPFVPASARQALQDASARDGGDGESTVSEVEQQALDAATAAREVEQLALETKSAIVCQRRVRLRLRREEERRQHAATPFTISWLTFAAAGKHHRAFTLGPVVEIAFTLDMQLKQLIRSRSALKKAWKTAQEDVLELAGDLMTSGSKLQHALAAVLDNLKASNPLIIASSPAKLRARLEQAPSLFREAETWFAELEGLALKSVPNNQHGQELAERMKIGVKGALTTPKERTRPTEEKEKPTLGGVDDDEDDEEAEERAEGLGRMRA